MSESDVIGSWTPVTVEQARQLVLLDFDNLADNTLMDGERARFVERLDALVLAVEQSDRAGAAEDQQRLSAYETKLAEQDKEIERLKAETAAARLVMVEMSRCPRCESCAQSAGYHLRDFPEQKD